MKTKYLRISFILIITALVSCSTKKNTWLSRNYQALNTHYNVKFNAKNSYDAGIKSIFSSNKDDYSSIIPMYPISNHSTATSAAADMDKTIEKCRKAIKLHSIKVKPKKKYDKMKDPDYLQFFNQEEFNPAIFKSWLLLGQAEYHKGAFLNSLGTFSYVAKHFSTDKYKVTQSKLWMVKAYAEMDWLYEAENVLSKINQNEVKHSDEGLFAAVSADLLLKKRQYKAAIPYLKIALANEHDKRLKIRFTFLLAQLYRQNNDYKAAYDTYSDVLKFNPPYEMEFNVRVSRAQLNTGDVTKLREELTGMLKNRNNKDYLDQIYYALGNTYIQHNDTSKAMAYYKMSADTSSRKGIEKAVTLITMGDIYYLKKNYLKAQPCYSDASTIITSQHESYERVKNRAETLTELTTLNDNVMLQDSLQHLATLSNSEKLISVKKYIAKLTEEEKLAALKLKAETEARKKEDSNNAYPTMQMNGGGMQGSSSWYFYNSDLLRNGVTDFSRKWGSRKLEDNWRRISKAALTNENQISERKSITEKDSVTSNDKKNLITDNKNPEFYLQQIPSTTEQIIKSQEELSKSLLSMALLYKEKLEDLPQAITIFEKFINRFPNDEKIAEAYFNLYLSQKQIGNQTAADKNKNKILSDFKDSKYYQYLSQGDFEKNINQSKITQDSIYNLTYEAYKRSDFETVFKQVAHVKEKYPSCSLMPKFLFVNALSIGKAQAPDKFKDALTELVTLYPSSDVSANAKDILSLIKQGMEAKNGTSSASLLTRTAKNNSDQNQLTNETTTTFSRTKLTHTKLLLVCSSKQDSDLNKILFRIADFNFSHFMIKDFDFAITKVDSAYNALSVSTFDSYDDGTWYLNSLQSDSIVSYDLKNYNIKPVIISEDNFNLIRTKRFTLTDYTEFIPKLLGAKEEENTNSKEKSITAPTVRDTQNKKKTNTIKK